LKGGLEKQIAGVGGYRERRPTSDQGWGGAQVGWQKRKAWGGGVHNRAEMERQGEFSGMWPLIRKIRNGKMRFRGEIKSLGGGGRGTVCMVRGKHREIFLPDLVKARMKEIPWETHPEEKGKKERRGDSQQRGGEETEGIRKKNEVVCRTVGSKSLAISSTKGKSAKWD